jgi:hypothetical protein
MERTGVPVYTLKAVLNHATGRDVTAQYVQVASDMKLAALQKIEQFVLGQGGVRCPPSEGPPIDPSSEPDLEPVEIAGEREGLRIAYTVPTRRLGGERGFWLQTLVPQEAANAYTAPTPLGEVGHGLG